MHMNRARPEPQVTQARPAADPHLLDVSMFWAPGSGVRQALMAKHERLHTLGWRHTLMAPGAQGSGTLDCGGVPLPGGAGHRWVLGRGRALRQMQLLSPDLIESADPYTLGWASLAAAEKLRVPAIAYCHGHHHLPAPGGAGERLARRYLVSLYRHFDLVMAPSSGLAQRLQAWGVPRVTVQPLGVDCSVFTPCARDAAWRTQFCETHGLDPATRLLVYTGRFTPEKNLQLLADAVALLGRGHVLLAVGQGPAPPVGGHVRLLPLEADGQRLARMVASCDAYVHAGDQETPGRGLLQAMACGTPVIAAGSAVRAELAGLADGAGLLVDRQRAGSWAEAMEASLSGNNTAQRRTALTRAQAQDWPRVLAQMTRRYAALTGRLAAPALPARRAPASFMSPRPWAGPLARQR
jgi:alpha-1,6-mannosyltransferase